MAANHFPFPSEPVALPKELSRNPLFFFGAGASVAAEVPDTTAFVKLFREWMKKSKHPGKAHLNGHLDKIIEKLEDGAQRPVDVELLMESLDALTSQYEGQGPSKLFAVEKSLGLLASDIVSMLKDALKQFIKRKALVEVERVGYLKDLVAFADSRPLDIFSVNYDTCVEQLCHAHRLKYTDGFELEWQPESFDRDAWDVRLYKVHGSVLWYESQQARYLKVPVMEDSITLFTGETASPLMLYPMRKWQYAEPLLELLVELKHRLESNEKTRIVVVVGYSFRDEYIKRLFWDAFRANKELVMLLIDPYAEDIYTKQLSQYPNGVASSMVGRVARLGFPFEKVLPTLKHGFLKNLVSGVFSVSRGHDAESRGGMGGWEEVLEPLLLAGHYDAFTAIRPKANFNSWGRELYIPILAATVAATLERAVETKRWVEEFSLAASSLLSKPEITLTRMLSGTKTGTHIDLVFRGSKFGDIRAGELAHQLERALAQVRFFTSLLLKDRHAGRRHLLDGIRVELELMIRHYRVIDQSHPMEECYAQTFDSHDTARKKAAELVAQFGQHLESSDQAHPKFMSEATAQLEKEFLASALKRLEARLK